MQDTYIESYIIKEEYDRKSKKRVAEYRYNEDNQLHHLNRPSIAKFHPRTGLLVAVDYYKNDVLHRDGGPAQERFSSMGDMVLEQHWHYEGQRHRANNEVASAIYDSDGFTLLQEYWVGGKLHRTNGPAIVEFSPETHKIISERFFIQGQEVKAESIPSLNPMPP